MNRTPRARPARNGSKLAALALGAVIDYCRWTQLIPMIAAWTFLLIGVAALLLVNFQEQSLALIERGIGIYEGAFGPIERTTGAAAAAPESGGETATPTRSTGGAVTFSDEDFMPVVLRGWAWAALAGYGLGLARAWLFGPWQPWPLRRKLALAAIAAAGASALMFASYFFGSETFNGGFRGWFALFTGTPLLVWLVSLYSLGIGHLLENLNRAINGGAKASGRVDNPGGVA